jgi:predicted TIM-barrel enzyme
MPATDRKAILARLQDLVCRRVPIGGSAGTGLSAKCEEAGGIDQFIIVNSGRYRMAGRASSAGLLAYGNANHIVKEMVSEVLLVVKKTLVLAAVNGNDCADAAIANRTETKGFLRPAKFSNPRVVRRRDAS